MTTSDNTWQRVVQRVTSSGTTSRATSNKEGQRMATSSNFGKEISGFFFE